MRPTTPRRIAAAVAVSTLAGCLSGCQAGQPDLPDPDAAAYALAAGLASGDLSAVAWRTSDPTADLAEVVDGMDGVTRTVTADPGEATQEGDRAATATVTLHWSWDLGGQEWTYDATTGLTRTRGRWRAAWTPALVEPSLRTGEVLDRQTIGAARGAILGAGGEPLVTQREVVRFGIDKTAVPAADAPASARALARLLDIDVRPYVQAVKAAGEQAFVEAITFRQEDVPARMGGVDAIPGARAIPDRADLGPSAEFAAPILGRVGPVTAEMVQKDPDRYQAGDVAGLSGLEARYDEQLAGTDGVTVDAVATDAKRREVYRVDAMDGEPLTTTLDERLQFAAEDALRAADQPAALVAIRPSDGAILAAANGALTNGVNLATYGQAAPGSTFKPISALALLRDGLTPQSRVDCPPSIVVDGKRISNYDEYPPDRLGRITLREALANSCNTAFAGNAYRVGTRGLAAAAATLGLGIDHDLGFPAYFGQVPDSTSETEVAATAIGQGQVLASPMVMATVAASVAAGHTVVPRLIDTVAVSVPDGVDPLTGKEARALRSMMRATVTIGPTGFLRTVPGPPVIAKTGTAEFDRDGARLKHAWLIAAQGDLAVAVYVDVGASGSGTAGPLMEQFLRAAR